MDQMQIPPWLESLLSTPFFSICSRHQDSPRNECNMYCIDCKNGAFCFYCRSSRHEDHNVIQIRRSSYHDVVRVAEIQNVLDISGIQTYVINSARVMFINERPQPKTTKGVPSHLCEVCGRSLLDSFRFCSLGCKVAGLKKNGEGNFNLSTKKENMEDSSKERIVIGRRLASKQDEEEDQEQEQEVEQVKLQTNPSTSHRNSNSRRRKGIPHRAPFRS
ncbi:protein RGF1 INDUCIBLE TRANSCRIPTION FACTOR 1-like [Euphorbia lathyris]|uniref:protein RGF1 INDUCIBLE TRANSCRIPTION FACTOR 1-like n=1 Tax=Euphorbia lathyris TaxID=212925 RepID=UPI0033130B32